MGHSVWSESRQLFLPADNLLEIKNCQQLITGKSVKARKLTGKDNSCPKRGSQLFHARSAVPSMSTRRGNPKGFEEMIQVPRKACKDLACWIENIQTQHGRFIQSLTPNLIFQTDASLTGWGAVCRAYQTGGHWLEHGTAWHISVLESQAIYQALKVFYKEYFQSAHSNKIRQCVHIKLHKQAGRNEKQGPPKGGRHNMNILLGTLDNLDRRACPRYSQRGSGLFFKTLGQRTALDAEKQTFDQISRALGPFRWTILLVFPNPNAHFIAVGNPTQGQGG